MLKSINDIQSKNIEQGTDSPRVSCESCGVQRPRHKMINVIIVVGSPGHESLPAFQCPNIEHWACGTDCWKLVSHACIDEHMHELLKGMQVDE